ncbi:MAG TPA: YceI family protein [Blastocatellia bacterium]|nr:YceI family protein [Blastocatellia bacterium]
MARLAVMLLALALTVGVISSIVAESVSSPAPGHAAEQTLAADTTVHTQPVAAASYKINPGQSRFTVRAFSGGVLWFMGHDHIFAVRDFTGEAQITPDSLTPASLQLRAKAASLEETRAHFTPQEKQIINKEARHEVLEADEYPEITFRSTEVVAEKTGDNQYVAKIGGDLTLHGVTRHIMIPAHVSIDGNTLHANGEFSINRSDYNVKTEAIKWGTIRIRDRVKFSFDIVADKL